LLEVILFFKMQSQGTKKWTGIGWDSNIFYIKQAIKPMFVEDKQRKLSI
jgi:hypothetical protein